MTAVNERIELRAAHDVVERLNDPQTGGRYERWVERARGCTRPVRLAGASRHADASTGELVREFTTDEEPDGVLMTPCGNRRAHVCPACSEVYRGDAFQLVAAGLRGGKGVPDSVAGHPLVFATFTAPSFGPVHTTRESKSGSRLACRPRSRGETCPHGRSLACTKRHSDDDACLGEAICPDCFDYERCALWNHNAGRLFKRTRTYVERELARQAGMTQKVARERVRVSYVKVAEFQRRGVVHFHTLWRLDGADRDELAPPPENFTVHQLADAITAALPKATVPAEDGADPYWWGRQHDVRALDLGADPREASRVAGYIAKYATKSTEDAGGVRYRIEQPHELRELRCREHARRLITGAWDAGEHEHVDEQRLRRWAHQFGFGGHCFTKSRRFSTTFKALREARAAHAAGHTEDAAKSDHNLVQVSAWQYAGSGYRKAGDALLAASSHARARDHRELARIERDTKSTTGGAA